MDDVGDGGGGGLEGFRGFVEGCADEGWGEGGLEKEGEGKEDQEKGANEGFVVVHDVIVLEKHGRNLDGERKAEGF